MFGTSPFRGFGFPLLVWMGIVGEVVVRAVLFLTLDAQLRNSLMLCASGGSPSGTKVNRKIDL